MYYLINTINYIIMLLLFIFIFKIKKQNIYKLMAISVFFIGLILYLTLGNLELTIQINNYKYNLLLSLILSLTLFSISLCLDDWRSFLFCLLPFFTDLAAKCLLSNALGILFNEVNKAQYYYWSPYLLISNNFFYAFILLLYYFTKRINKAEDNKAISILYIVILTIELISFLIINLNLLKTIFFVPADYPKVILLNVLFIILFITTLFAIYFIQNLIIKKNNMINKYNNELLLNDFKKIYISKQEELFKMRHDIANIVETLKTLESLQAMDIASTLSNQIKEIKDIYFTENELVNAILVHKINCAKELGIEVTTEIKLQKDIKMANADLISLITNLFDNAIEAASKTLKKEIYLTINQTDSALEISFLNTYDKDIIITKENPQYHQYGQKIISNIVKKYKGQLIVQPNDIEYKVFIILKL